MCFPSLQNPSTNNDFCGVITLSLSAVGAGRSAQRAVPDDDPLCASLSPCRPDQDCVNGVCRCPIGTIPCPSETEPQFCFAGGICPDCQPPVCGPDPVSKCSLCSSQACETSLSEMLAGAVLARSFPCPAVSCIIHCSGSVLLPHLSLLLVSQFAGPLEPQCLSVRSDRSGKCLRGLLWFHAFLHQRSL